MRIRSGVILLCAILVFVGCSKATDEERALETAKTYYDKLITRDYEHFLDGIDMVGRMDSLTQTTPDDTLSYRAQLLTSLRLFLSQQEGAHRGIRAIRSVNAVREKQSDYMNAFLVLCYGDSTNEEIVVPMVERNGIWKMK